MFVSWIIFQANIGANNLFFSWIRTIPYGDKIGHFCIFGFLTFVSLFASRFHHFYLKRLRVYSAALAVTVVVIAEEISQGFIPSRTLDAGDLIADMAGIVLFSVGAIWLNNQLKIYKASV